MTSPRQVVVLWATAFVAAAAFFLSGEASLGVNWGTITYHRLPPKTVARLLRDNGIKKVKLFDVDRYTMETLSGTGIQVMIAVNNLLLAPMTNYAAARAWVSANVTHYRTDLRVDIKYVAVGNEPFLKDYKDRFTNVTLPALKNIQRALDEAGLGGEIKATVPINADIYYSPWYNPAPSGGKWRDDVAGVMSDIVRYYNETGAPFTVNIYPFFSLYIDPNFPADFAFFDGKAKPVVDGDFVYTNVFDANYDTLLAALKSEGCGDVPIIVGEVGWPTDGDVHANVSIAERFYKGMTQKIAGKIGTPRRPKEDIEVYLFGLFDEEAKSILPGPFERSWGIFSTDGKPKFPVDLSGGGAAGKAAVAAAGVDYLPRKWCVLNAEAAQARNETRIRANLDYACSHGADCMPLGDGSSCSGMDLEKQASYAFNSYFQALGQGAGTCGFDGLGKETTTKDYSSGTCKFEIGFKPFDPNAVEAAPAPAPAAESADSPAKAENHGDRDQGGETSEGRRRSGWKVGSGIMALALAGFLLD